MTTFPPGCKTFVLASFVTFPELAQLMQTELTIQEKLITLYCGLRIARQTFFLATGNAFLKKQLSASKRNDWEQFFTDQYEQARKADIRTYEGRAWLEYKARHLMHLAENIKFENMEEPWQGYSIPLDNTFFPLPAR